MRKSIKKSLYYLIIPVAVILLLPVTLFPIIRIPSVQTFLVNGITEYISSQTSSTISIGDIELSFYNRLVARNILILDHNKDTLLFTPRLSVGLRHLNRNKGIIVLSRVTLLNPVVGLITDSTGSMNLSWYIDKLRQPADTVQRNKNSLFHISRFEITDGRLSILNRNAKPSEAPIDFSNLNLVRLNAAINNLEVRDDSLYMDINTLAFNEGKGFTVRNIHGDLVISGTDILLKNTVIDCDSSTIKATRIGILADSAGSFSRFTDEVRLNIELEKSEVSFHDLKYFLPFLEKVHDSVRLAGKISGTISELKGRNVNIAYKQETFIDCDFDLSGLPNIDNTFIFLEINDFRSITSDIEMIDIPGKGYIEIPEQLKKLGIISFTGTFTGFTTDFVTYAKINTNRGVISTDISLRPEGDKNFRIKGLLKGTGINLGELTGNKLLGNMTIETNVDGFTNSFKTFSVNLTGNIDTVEINNYSYRNIALNGNFSDKTWDGNIKIEEDNIHLDLMGLFDFSNDLPEFDFTLNLLKADLYKLNIDKNDPSAFASLLLTANFIGNNIDNLNGDIKLLNSSFIKYSKNLEAYDFSLKTLTSNTVPSISLRTDFADADLKGQYNFAGLGSVVKTILATLIPSKYTMPDPKASHGGNNFVLDVNLKKTNDINDFFRTGIRIAENSMISGSIISDSVINLSCSASTLAFKNSILKNLKVTGSYRDTLADLRIACSSVLLAGLSELKSIDLNIAGMPDRFDLGLTWDNKENILNKGNFEADGFFSRNENKKGRTFLTINLLKNDIYVKDKVLRINPATIVIDTNSVRISKFNISSNENYMLIDGAISENTDDTLFLRFNGISINPLNTLYEKKMGNTPDMLHLSLAGIMSGNISLTNIYKNFMFESSVLIHDFALLESQYGDIRIGSVWNKTNKVADITGNNNYLGQKMFDLKGSYDPETRLMNLDAIADKLPIEVLNPLLNMFASEITGTASGKVNLKGELSEPVLTGSLWGDNASMKIDYLQTKYSFSDSIRFDKSGIKFNNIRCLDPKGNIATLNGTVYHKYFKDFAVDLTVRTNDCLVLDTRAKDNDLFYGTAYASGVTTIKSVGPVLRFDISAKTGKNTRFYIPLNTGSSVAENSFVTFVDHSAADNAVDAEVRVLPPPVTPTELEIAFDLEVTPEAEVQLIMDSKTGDIMKGTGTGNLNISLDKKAIFKIYGDYMISEGDYLFTLGNIINKSFSVESGGKITFNGDVENADIDIKAIYKTKASLSELMPDLPEEQLRERIPVECQLILTGNLFNPVVGFDIYLPTANEATRAYLKSMIKSDEDMSRQFLFLLVMNSFYADAQIASQNAPGIGSATVGVTTMEMLSNQLSNWLSQISNDFDIGVVYRPGSTTLPNSQELQVALSTQLLNDRVSINGNFDVAGSQAATGNANIPTGNNQITGAFDIEYSINEKIKFKFFNRSNDNFYIDNGYTQGIGLFFRQDFNKLKDLFNKPPKGEMKNEETPVVEKD